MKNIVSKRTLKDFWAKHPDVQTALETWYFIALNANWIKPNDVLLDYPTASLLRDNRVVFNIKGNKYRLVVRINYKMQWIFIRFIGKHADYDRVDVNII